MKQPFDLVLVEWLDSGRNADWTPLDDVSEPAPVICQSVGWLVRKTKHAILLMANLSHPEGAAIHQGCGSLSIPTCSIASIKTLRPAKKT